MLRSSPVPHSLHTSPSTSICLLTTDPQREYKNIIAHPAFPAEIRPFIKRVIGLSKLKKKFKSFESRRQLASEHTHFLADERIVTYLPNILGKTFYKTTAKRPVPVRLTGKAQKRTNRDSVVKAKKERRSAGDLSSVLSGSPEEIGRDISKALNCALINLSPAATTSIRVGFADWSAEKVRDNVQAVLSGLLESGAKGEKVVPGGWRNVKSIHLKGTKTAALPLWLTDELWMEGDVIEQAPGAAIENGGSSSSSSSNSGAAEGVSAAPAQIEGAKKSKRKATDEAGAGAAEANGKGSAAGAAETSKPPVKAVKSKVSQTASSAVASSSAGAPSAVASSSSSKKPSAKDQLARDIAQRKEKLKAQRAKAMDKIMS